MGARLSAGTALAGITSPTVGIGRDLHRQRHGEPAEPVYRTTPAAAPAGLIGITGDITLTTTELTAITKGVTITSSSHTISSSDNAASSSSPRRAAAPIRHFHDVTLANGYARGGDGRNGGGGGMGAGGCAIFAMSGDRLTNVGLDDNVACKAWPAASGTYGGGGGLGGNGGMNSNSFSVPWRGWRRHRARRHRRVGSCASRRGGHHPGWSERRQWQ